MFKDIDVDYCQFKPEVVNREREGGIQRDIDFCNEKVVQVETKTINMLKEVSYNLQELTEHSEK